MANKAYNYSFKMYMEGVQIPFKSIQIMCTPNGVEANINLLSNLQVFDLKPKTAVQVFYKDWVPIKGKMGWRLMFDGFLSSYVKQDQSTEGRGLGIVCRDFRMDIRKAPAAIAWQAIQDVGEARSKFHTVGIHQKVVIDGKKIDVRTFDQTGIHSFADAIARIAGTAYNLSEKKKRKQKGKPLYESMFADSLKKTSKGSAACGLFLDAVVRGIWTEAVAGTDASTFMNKRIRADKRFLIPSNKTGFEFWSRQVGGLQGGSVLMGNSQFSSIEAAIMRLAGLFSVRVYSCNTPSLISLESEALPWVMDPDVKKFLVNDHAEEFGAKYILNETMLLPPLEFTAPPNCNLFFPPMYHSVNWQYDIDADVTRGYFSVVDTISTGRSDDLKGMSIQVPNALFDIYSPGRKVNSKDKRPNAKVDDNNQKKTPMTLEERYKGVSTTYGSVEDLLARNDANKSWPESTYKLAVAGKIRREEAKLRQEVDNLKNSVTNEILDDSLSLAEKALAEAQIKKKNILKEAEAEYSQQLKAKGGGHSNKNTKVALDRHAVLKFLNHRYVGRVAVVDMAFNPYPMAGFPGAIIVDDEAFGANSSRTIIGMVQQVKHMITISPSGGDATTSIVLNNARFENEPTDVDIHGNPLYMKATNTDEDTGAVLGEEVDVFKKDYFPPDPEPLIVRDLDDKFYDLDDNEQAKDHIYAKDVITLSEKDIISGENNGSYLDNDYLPNRIHKFYKDVFSHHEDHFMIGVTRSKKDPKKKIRFVYDTMHEAFSRMKEKGSPSDKRYLLTNYEECIKYVSRDICSADAFFQGILGLSVKKKLYDDEGNFIGEIYVNKTSGYDPEDIREFYFGVTDDAWNNSKKVKGLKAPSVKPLDINHNGKMEGPGQFSSIKEHMPVTAFLQERRDAVIAYLKTVKERAEGVQFANIERHRKVK